MDSGIFFFDGGEDDVVPGEIFPIDVIGPEAFQTHFLGVVVIAAVRGPFCKDGIPEGMDRHIGRFGFEGQDQLPIAQTSVRFFCDLSPDGAAATTIAIRIQDFYDVVKVLFVEFPIDEALRFFIGFVIGMAGKGLQEMFSDIPDFPFRPFETVLGVTNIGHGNFLLLAKLALLAKFFQNGHEIVVRFAQPIMNPADDDPRSPSPITERRTNRRSHDVGQVIW